MASSTKLLLLLSTLLLVQLLSFCNAQSSVNGGYWFPGSEFPVSSIDSTLFTHLFCAFADLNPTTNQITISSANAVAFSQFTATVQAKNPSVKTLLSLGGGNSTIATYFAAMASQAGSRKSFIDSSIRVARSNGFSGLDLDWEYPRSSSDMTNLETLLTEWRQAVASEAQSSGRPALLLTAAFYLSANLNELVYPAQSVNTNLDFVNLMAYDNYDPSWYRFTNSHSMLYDPSNPIISGSSGVEAWIRAGVSARKLVLGVPFYGYAWRLADANNRGMLAPATGPAVDGGTMGYNQIKRFIAQNNAVVVYNGTLVTNYVSSGTTWIGYDDTQSIAIKVRYAKQRGLLGYFAWHVGADDNWALSRQAKQSWGA